MDEMNEYQNSPSVAIDGTVIRRIREDSRLTQLYVAKVVGVTTDTVSRWENNRYPTIRRDNALKLAEALEVDLADILKQDPEESPSSAADPAPLPGNSLSARKRYAFILGALVVVLVLLAIFWLRQQQGIPLHLQAVRILPPYAAPGSKILLQVDVEAEQPLKMILKERLPAGWRFVDAKPKASNGDEKNGLVRWIFKTPLHQAKIFYLLEVAAAARVGEHIEVSGELVANTATGPYTVAIPSRGKLTVAPLHWADRNGNSVIDDMEILAVSDLSAETGDALVNWNLIEDLWEAGGYRWDQQERRFVPAPRASEQPAQ